MPAYWIKDGERRVDARHVTRLFHPAVYKWIAWLVGLYLVASWNIAGQPDTDYLMLVVTGVFLMSFVLAWASFNTSLPIKQVGGSAEAQHAPGLSDWSRREFDAYSGRFKAAEAAIEALLPIAAVAFGIAAMAIATSLAD